MTRTARFTAAGLLAATATVGALAAGTDSAGAVVVPDRHTIVCQSATMYANYDSASGPSGVMRTLTYGNGVGHTNGAHPVINGWAAIQDFGPNDWGYVRVECLS